ncbi:MAG: hypothetical protein KBT20_05990 [Bacteroidales bacterium]|nr:hypothetical protein [Candidatus Liminaster caballi]
MKSLRVMAMAMIVAMVSFSMVSCGGNKQEAPAADAPAVEEAPVAVADSTCCGDSACCCDSVACDSCCQAAAAE